MTKNVFEASCFSRNGGNSGKSWYGENRSGDPIHSPGRENRPEPSPRGPQTVHRPGHLRTGGDQPDPRSDVATPTHLRFSGRGVLNSAKDFTASERESIARAIEEDEQFKKHPGKLVDPREECEGSRIW